MARANEPLECVICNEDLVDPRALPCGHCYCGPPRLCLNSMESSDSDVIKCAVCRSDHRLKVFDIKPLYGIREYFQSKTAEKLVLVPCSVHNFEECTNWCSTCDVKICERCFEVEHDGHSVRKLKPYLREKLEKRMGLKLEDGLKHHRDKLQQLVETKTSHVKNLKDQVDYLQLQIADFECDLKSLMKERSLVYEYCNFLDGKALDENSSEVSLLLNLLELNLSKHSVDACSKDQSTEYAGSSKNCASRTDSNDKQPYEIIHTTRIELCSFLHVFNRNPLNVQSSDNLIVGCHSVFRISGYCVNCLLHRNKKWCDERSFRIYVSRTTIVPNSVLPVLTYKLVLKNHADSKQNRQTTGSWDCSRQSEIIWDCISYADLVNPHKKWIHNAAFIEVSFAGDFVVSTLV